MISKIGEITKQIVGDALVTSLAELFRRRIQVAVDDARAARPSCSIGYSAERDDEGRVWVKFSCAVHGTEWRELLGVTQGKVCGIDK